VIEQIRAGAIAQTSYVYGQAMPAWTPITQVPAFAQAFAPHAAPPPPVAPPAQAAPVTSADQIDFTIGGGDAQFVEIVLDPHEAAIADPSFVFFLEAGIRVDAGAYVNTATTRQRAAFAPLRPARVVPVDLRQYGQALLVRANGFLCAAKGIHIGAVADGYQTVAGSGLVFLQAGGAVVVRELAAGEVLRVDAKCVVAIEQRVGHLDAPPVATLTGPGKVWLQSLRH